MSIYLCAGVFLWKWEDPGEVRVNRCWTKVKLPLWNYCTGEKYLQQKLSLPCGSFTVFVVCIVACLGRWTSGKALGCGVGYVARWDLQRKLDTEVVPLTTSGVNQPNQISGFSGIIVIFQLIFIKVIYENEHSIWLVYIIYMCLFYSKGVCTQLYFHI